MKIYIASPLFTPEEKKVITEVAAILHKAGFETYLPMENGVQMLGLILTTYGQAKCLRSIERLLMIVMLFYVYTTA